MMLFPLEFKLGEQYYNRHHSAWLTIASITRDKVTSRIKHKESVADVILQNETQYQIRQARDTAW